VNVANLICKKMLQIFTSQQLAIRISAVKLPSDKIMESFFVHQCMLLSFLQKLSSQKKFAISWVHIAVHQEYIIPGQVPLPVFSVPTYSKL
jgi:hypothetical protein